MHSESKLDYVAISKPYHGVPYNLIHDGVKWLMVLAKVTLEVLGVWHEQQNKLAVIANIFYISSLVLVIAAQIVYVFNRDTNFATAIDILTGIIVCSEALGRRILSVLLEKRISKILPRLYCEFWPSDIAGKGLHSWLKWRSRVLVAACIYEAVAGVVWAWQSILPKLPLNALPIPSNFWTNQSPFYELLFVWQGVICFDVIASISALDFFLLSIMLLCVSQFKLLRKYIEEEFFKIIQNSETTLEVKSLQARRLMLKCIKRHIRLINTCKKIESMLTIFILMLYMGTVGTVCLSSFMLTVAKQEVGKALPYFAGHMTQTFHYCYIGHELIVESMAVASAVARCGWHLLPYDKVLQKSLVLMMARSQRPVTMTMGGFGVLSLSSYMKLIQFCFSVYTVLSSTVNRSERN